MVKWEDLNDLLWGYWHVSHSDDMVLCALNKSNMIDDQNWLGQKCFLSIKNPSILSQEFLNPKK
jgi:hypothetical protein